MDGGYVETDETMIEYLLPGNGEIKQGYVWTIKRLGGDALFALRTCGASLTKPKPANPNEPRGSCY
jgi:hypothetical protein